MRSCTKPALRCPFLALRPGPVLDDPCGQPLADQPQDPLIRDPVPEKLLQPASIELPEEVADIRVQHPVHSPPHDPGYQGIQCLVRAAPWPEPVGETPEVLLIDGIQHIHHGPLDDLVLQRGDAERPQPPVRLGDVRPACSATPGSVPAAPARAGPGGSPPGPARTLPTS